MDKRVNLDMTIINVHGDFTDRPVVKDLPSNAWDTGLIPIWGTKFHMPCPGAAKLMLSNY